MGKLVSYNDFRGGYNDTASPDNLKKNELLVAENIDLGESGGFNTRHGVEKINQTSFNGEVTQEFEYIAGKKIFRVAIINRKVYFINSDGTKTEKITIQSDKVGHLVIQGNLYIMDGHEIYILTDTTADPITPHNSSQKEVVQLTINSEAEKQGDIEITLNGVKKSINITSNKEVIDLTITKAPTKTENITVILDDKVTFVNAYIDETIDQLAERIRAFPFEGYETSGTGAKITFTAKEIGAKGKHYFGGGETGAEGTMTVTTQGSSNSINDIALLIKNTAFEGYTNTVAENVVTFTATVAELRENAIWNKKDTGIEATMETITEGKDNDCDLEPIKKCTMFVQHPKSLRIFAGGNPDNPLALYYSEINNMAYFVADSELYPTNSEGNITGLTALMDDILVSYNNSWWHYRGLDPEEDATWKRLTIPYGCISNDSIVLTPYSFTFLAREGIFRVSASILSQEVIMLQGERIITNLTKDKVENTIKSIINPQSACGVFHDNKYYLAYSDEGTKNNKVLVCYLDTKSFVKYSGWQVNSWNKQANGNLTFATKNFILKTGIGYIDIDVDTGESKPIHVLVETKNLNLGADLNNKYIQFMYLQFRQYRKMKSDINISLIADYKNILLDKVSLAESLIWGRVWGSVWGYKDLVEKMAEIKEFATRVKVRIENNNLDDPIGMYGIGFEFKPLRPKARMVVRDEGRLLE